MPKTLTPLPSQIATCKKCGVIPCTFTEHDFLGIALKSLQSVPINGMRIPALTGSSGWYIYGGSEASNEPHFYQPMHISHLRKHCEIAVPYLCLPAGWRFQIDADGYEDVWFDANLLKAQSG